MEPTWRERVAAARARQHRQWWWRLLRPFVLLSFPFTDADHHAWFNISRCPAGEAIAHYGFGVFEFEARDRLYGVGAKFGHALMDGDVAQAEHWLDVIDDVALELKRQQQT